MKVYMNNVYTVKGNEKIINLEKIRKACGIT